MSRPRSFCTDSALDRAMTVFWQKGYDGASLSDIVAATGINPPSLYAAFGSKEGLFRAVLERYDARRKDMMDRVFAAPNAKSVARLFLESVADFAADTSGRNPPGCFLVQSGLSGSERDIPDALAQRRAEKEAMLRDRFARDKADGNLLESADPTVLAAYLVAMANGMAVQAAAGATSEQLRKVARMAIEAWPVAESARAMRPAKKRLARGAV